MTVAKMTILIAPLFASLVAAITTLSPLPFSAVALAKDGALEPARQKEILYLLRQDCGSCHGMTLKGGLGSSLLPEVLKDKPSAFLVETIREGRQGTAMPPWKQFLTQQETEWLVETLKTGVKE